MKLMIATLTATTVLASTASAMIIQTDLNSRDVVLGDVSLGVFALGITPNASQLGLDGHSLDRPMTDFFNSQTFEDED